jgi:hypothetical protein
VVVCYGRCYLGGVVVVRSSSLVGLVLWLCQLFFVCILRSSLLVKSSTMFAVCNLDDARRYRFSLA